MAMVEHPPEWWKRYVDDIETMLKKAHAQAFTNHVNSLEEDIKWTTEREVTTEVKEEKEVGVTTERALAFLDTWSVIKEDCNIVSPECSEKIPIWTNS